MKKIFALLITAGSVFTLASCSVDNDPDTALAKEELSARKVLTVSESYAHGKVYPGSDAYKITTTLLSEGMDIVYGGYTFGYAGSGYVLEIDFNSAQEAALSGKYVADTIDEAASAQKGKNVWKHAAQTFNPDNTSLKYLSGDESEIVIKDAVFTVSTEGDKYVIDAEIVNILGTVLNLKFKGELSFSDVLFYLEPEEAAEFTLKCTDAAVEADPSNAQLFAEYVSSGFAPQLFHLNLTGENGEAVSLSLLDYQYPEEPITVKSFTNLPTSAIYSTDESADQYISQGMWDILSYDDDGNGFYNTNLAYRDQAPVDSHIIAGDGVVYYLGWGNDTADIKLNNDGSVKSVDAVLYSANGTKFTVKYAAE